MAGTLTLSTLSDGTNSTNATDAIRGSARAWVNFNGVSGTIRASYNVASVTKNGTGDYTVNFTNAMPDTNYVITGSSRELDNTNRNGSMFGTTGQTLSNTYMTTGARVANFYPVNADAYDAVLMTVAIFR